MTTGQSTAAPPATAGSFDTAWRELRADDDIQFAQVEMPQSDQPPDWLERFFQWLADFLAPVGNLLVRSWPVLMWVLIVLAVLLAAYALYRLFGSGTGSRRRNAAHKDDWAPQQGDALALLEEADRLAAAGDYDEAAHLLLKRSVGQIAAARPDLVDPSSTARELAAEPRLPEAARNAFALIAAPVERSLFALRKLEERDWHAARAAYADFALAQGSLSQEAIAA